ncbi:MAG: response regulator [Chromatiales bacterium]|jgi:tetratricopeptide (TPR) repeat protein
MLQNLLNQRSYLVVDDFGDMRSTLRSMLSLFGVTDIDNAKNGADAIQQMEHKRYGVVLCDYNLGIGKDGQQVLEEARHRNLISVSTAFIMITAENTLSMVLGALEYEPDSYLYKPFTKDLLRNRLEKVLSKKKDLQRVDEALEGKDYASAIKLLDRRIDTKPKNLAELLRLKGDICIRAGAYEEAAGIFEQTLAIREVPWARMGIGKVQYGLKQYDAARTTFQDIIDGNERFTAAYDWLARTLKALGDPQGSQDVLSVAVKISPKAILRQQELAEIALENKDFDIAEKAFGQAVNLGRFSIHKHPKYYAGLVESKVSNEQTKNKQNAFKVIEQMQREFKGNREAEIYAAITSAAVHRSLGNEEKALASMKTAERLYDQADLQNNPELTLSMAKVNAKLGHDEKAKELFQSVIKNNHDDDEFLRNVRAALDQSGMSESASSMISETKKEIITLNNNGVRLVSEGQIEEAIGLFQRAADGMSGNKTINLNAAKVMIMYMEKNSLETQYLSQARQYVERVQKLDPEHKGLAKLVARLKDLVSQIN